MSTELNTPSPSDRTHAASGLERFLETDLFRSMIIALIIINAVILGVLTYDHSLSPLLVNTLEIIDQSITYVFAIEIGAKLIAYRHHFFKSGWNVFDFFIVAPSYERCAFCGCFAFCNLFRSFAELPKHS